MSNPLMVKPSRLSYTAKPRRRFHKPDWMEDRHMVEFILEDDNYGENDCCEDCSPLSFRRCMGCGAKRPLFHYVCDACLPEAQREARWAKRRLDREAMPFGEWMHGS